MLWADDGNRKIHSKDFILRIKTRNRSVVIESGKRQVASKSLQGSTFFSLKCHSSVDQLNLVRTAMLVCFLKMVRKVLVRRETSFSLASGFQLSQKNAFSSVDVDVVAAALCFQPDTLTLTLLRTHTLLHTDTQPLCLSLFYSLKHTHSLTHTCFTSQQQLSLSPHMKERKEDRQREREREREREWVEE